MNYNIFELNMLDKAKDEFNGGQPSWPSNINDNHINTIIEG